LLHFSRAFHYAIRDDRLVYFMASFDWTAYILFKQVGALKDELDKIEIPERHTVVPAARGPSITFKEILPKAKEVLSDLPEFAESIEAIADYSEVGIINTGMASQVRADVGVLLRTLEAFIQATFPQAEKKKIGFV